MNPVAVVVGVTLVWAAGTGDFGPANLLLGAGVGGLASLVLGAGAAPWRGWRRVGLLAGRLLGGTARQAGRVAVEVLDPRRRESAGAMRVAVPLASASDVEIALLAVMVTLCEGALSVDVSKNRSTLLVEIAGGDDPDAVIARIKDRLEKPIMEVFADDGRR